MLTCTKNCQGHYHHKDCNLFRITKFLHKRKSLNIVHIIGYGEEHCEWFPHEDVWEMIQDRTDCENDCYVEFGLGSSENDTHLVKLLDELGLPHEDKELFLWVT